MQLSADEIIQNTLNIVDIVKETLLFHMNTNLLAFHAATT